MGALQAQVAPTEDLEADGGVEHVLLLEYSRCPQEFHQALRQGAPLEQCRQALVKAKRYWELPSRAKVFVHPRQFEQTVDLLDKLDLVLLKQHVVAAESLEKNVIASLSDLRLNVTIRHLGAVRTSAASSSKAFCSKPPGQGARQPARAKKDNPQEGVAAVKKRAYSNAKLFEGDGPYPARARPRTPDPTDSTGDREWAQPWRKDLSLSKWLAASASQTPRKRRAADIGGAGSEDGPARAELSDAADEVRAAAGSAAGSSAQTEMCRACGKNPPGGWCSRRACVARCPAATGGPWCEQHWG